MKIIRSGAKLVESKIVQAGSLAAGGEEIPFVPAWDLFEAEKLELSEEEAAAAALALYTLIPDEHDRDSLWSQSARIEGISRRY